MPILRALQIFFAFVTFFALGALGVRYTTVELSIQNAQLKTALQQKSQPSVAPEFAQIAAASKDLTTQLTEINEQATSLTASYGNFKSSITDVSTTEDIPDIEDIKKQLPALSALHNDITKAAADAAEQAKNNTGKAQTQQAADTEPTAPAAEPTAVIPTISLSATQNFAKQLKEIETALNGSLSKTTTKQITSDLSAIRTAADNWSQELTKFTTDLQQVQTSLTALDTISENIQSPAAQSTPLAIPDIELKPTFWYFYIAGILVIMIGFARLLGQPATQNKAKKAPKSVEKIEPAPVSQPIEADIVSEKNEANEALQAIKKLSTVLNEDIDAALSESRSELTDHIDSLSKMLIGLKDDAADSSMMCSSVRDAATNSSEEVAKAAAAIEEMGASIGSMSGQVAQVGQVSSEAGSRVDTASENMNRLRETANEIGAIVSMINDIADQTNLLALNATIEAARAGEAGRGFSVVANEVKALSGQTAEATEKISSQIKAMQCAVDTAVSSITGIRDVMGRMDEISSSVASAIDQQGAAIHQITTNTSRVSDGANEISGDVQAVQDTINNTHKAAEEVMNYTQAMKNEIDALEGRFAPISDKISKIG